ncbi:MAG: tRNA 5-methoxyuridine(34)/uridine 5-oxyacetic acid(34) synthase CmoB [Gammaproteobacteria bacterium]|nr:tRNA 5-methoxyuridine(34)/uridine 5-oxyacetic acid(34) synthase CmoB [Gammaproteobacteria bacterium]
MPIKDFYPLDDLKYLLGTTELQGKAALFSSVESLIEHCQHGDVPRWMAALKAIQEFASPLCEVGETLNLGYSASHPEKLIPHLQQLKPWRKGPFNLADVFIDTEWHSDWKWQRVAPHLSDMTYRTVLDVGCGNGYFGYQMLGAGAKAVLGIDPMWLFISQFLVLREFAGNVPNFVLPLGVDDLPENLTGFDTVFSMGVLYHRKSHLEHLAKLKSLLREEGELVLETLVLDTDEDKVLIPEGRYAKMRNVWAVPSLSVLKQWTKDAGFNNVRIVDVTETTIDEQRCTEWMSFESLPDFLDKDDKSKTVEGHPRPVRAVVIANK